jgi:hypothetical protein
VQPIENLLLLAQTRISLSIFSILSGSVAKRSFRAIGIAFAVVRLFPPAADEKQVSNPDITTLSGRSNVHALVFAALVQLFPGNWVVVVRVVVDAFFMRIATVVEKNSTSCDAVLCPVMYGAFVVC